jgi:hypothetical protein
MKKHIFFIILLYSNFGFSQSKLRELIQFVNNNIERKLLNENELKFIKCAKTIEDLLNHEEIDKNYQSEQNICLFSSDNIDSIIKINERLFKLLRLDKLTNLYVADNGSFFIHNEIENHFYFVVSHTPSYLDSDLSPALIGKIKSIYYLNENLSPLICLNINNDYILTTSHFEYFENYIKENIYLEKADFERVHHNILEMPLKRLFYILKFGPLPLMYLRKISIKLNKKNINDFFWFLYLSDYQLPED